MERHAVRSTSIAEIAYDPRTRTLEVSLESGRVYRYFGVARPVVDDFLAAPSKGRFYNAHIRSDYEYERVLPRAPDPV